MRRAGRAGLLVLALVVAACSSSERDDDAAGAADVAPTSEDAATRAMTAADEDLSGGEEAVATGGGQLGPLPALGARVVRTADLRIEVEKGSFAAQLRSVSTLARALGGFVESSSTTSYEEGEASGEITIRVPVDQYDTAMERLAEVGVVERSSEDGQDVSDQLVDLEARLRALRAEEDALHALMAEAGNVNEVLSIRSTTVGIRQQIEQLAAQQATLEDRASYSTISVLLHESAAEVATAGPGGDEWTIADAFETGFDAARTIVGSVIVAVAVAVPLLPFAAAAWWLARRRRRSAVTS